MTLRLALVILAAAAAATLTACASSPTPTQRAAEAVQTREPSLREQADALRKTDRAAAHTLYSQACDAGDGEACHGAALTVDEDASGSQALAVEYRERGCELDYAFSCHSLGMSFWNGRDVEPDYARSIEYLRKSCRLGDDNDCSLAQGRTEKLATQSPEEIAAEVRQTHDFKRAITTATRAANDACASDADITGKPNVRFTVTLDGRVTQVHLVEAQYQATATEACLQRVLDGQQLPTLGEEHTITYPLKFGTP